MCIRDRRWVTRCLQILQLNTTNIHQSLINMVIPYKTLCFTVYKAVFSTWIKLPRDILMMCKSTVILAPSPPLQFFQNLCWGPKILFLTEYKLKVYMISYFYGLYLSEYIFDHLPNIEDRKQLAKFTWYRRLLFWTRSWILLYPITYKLKQLY